MRGGPLSISFDWRLRLDAMLRLGPRPVVLALLGRGALTRAMVAVRLRDRLSPVALRAPFPAIPAAGGFDAALRAARLRPMAGPDIRPLWEANRWAELPRLALAGEAARMPEHLAAWFAANPPYRGPNWGCGQEAALRALHLALAAALAGMEPDAGAMRLLARRIGANPAYAMAQDNNHPISEAAGLLVCGLATGEARMARRGARRLDAAVARLVAPDGSFAQPSPAYHRLLLDVVSVAEWLRRRGSGPPAAPATRERMAAATRWLHFLACPQTGALPRIGHQDGSHFADLSGAGPEDARASLERAARLFCGASAGWRQDPGCAAMGLPAPEDTLPEPGDWASLGFLARRSGGARAIIRTGPLRFRPGHADLLHLDLWVGAKNLLRDGGTGAYNPQDPGWIPYFQGARAHNTIGFDGEDQMPRLGPFLFAHWPETGALPEGGWLRDWRGRFHAREVFATAEGYRIEDRVGGPFREAVLRWRLAPGGGWRPTRDGVEGPLRLSISGDAAIAFSLVEGQESLAYGKASPLPVLEARIGPGATRVTTLIRLS
ncbi:heparinase [Roseococcus sp. SYP-B2431]|uniref:heparinase II/III domain-containing protein n=1 Tax=Roseococcus sp. SYP-B2431 TaxID=2496640 RepID=UPI00103D7769|nr:heparinase II/III family protein [Roseococcus sp. SYP-B2431]TCH98086.1 heparinase [Roseococcus sp. SYP-B2431]